MNSEQKIVISLRCLIADEVFCNSFIAAQGYVLPLGLLSEIFYLNLSCYDKTTN